MLFRAILITLISLFAFLPQGEAKHKHRTDRVEQEDCDKQCKKEKSREKRHSKKEKKREKKCKKKGPDHKSCKPKRVKKRVKERENRKERHKKGERTSGSFITKEEKQDIGGMIPQKAECNGGGFEGDEKNELYGVEYHHSNAVEQTIEASVDVPDTFLTETPAKPVQDSEKHLYTPPHDDDSNSYSILDPRWWLAR